MTEIKLFYDWLETHNLSPASITLWHGLMFIANRSRWQANLSIPLSVLEARTKIPRASIYREREKLREAGLIRFIPQGGKSSSIYTICSFGQHLASHSGTQSESQDVEIGLDSHLVSQIETHSENIYKLNYTSIKKNRMEVGADAPECLSPEKREKEKSCGKKEKEKKAPHSDDTRFGKFQKWIEENAPAVGKMREPFTEPQFEQLMSRYSHQEVTRVMLAMENYVPLGKKNKSAYLTVLNWLGRQASLQAQPRGQPAMGQHIGQIKQPETEEKKQKILERFENKK